MQIVLEAVQPEQLLHRIPEPEQPKSRSLHWRRQSQKSRHQTGDDNQANGGDEAAFHQPRDQNGYGHRHSRRQSEDCSVTPGG
ncbi:hypothetical protein [Brevundimonas sp.]|uniref:hypothetical protein n=1 Tax=Brevundimonas sp. TaxID=1871086 RepID=UPI0035B1FE82